MSERSQTVVEVCPLPNGYMLYRSVDGAGGVRYYSDEIGGGVIVWDASLVDESSVLAAIVEERRRLTRVRLGSCSVAAAQHADR